MVCFADQREARRAEAHPEGKLKILGLLPMDSKSQARFCQTTFNIAAATGNVAVMREQYYLPGDIDFVATIHVSQPDALKLIASWCNNENILLIAIRTIIVTPKFDLSVLQSLRLPAQAFAAMIFAVQANHIQAIREIYTWKCWPVEQLLMLLDQAHLEDATYALIYKLLGTEAKQSTQPDVLLVAAMYNDWLPMFQALWPFRSEDAGFTLLSLSKNLKRDRYRAWMFRNFTHELCYSGLRHILKDFHLGAYSSTSSI